MFNKHDLERDINKGSRADQILNDPLVKEALQEMRNTVFLNIETSKWWRKREREELYKQLRAIGAFELSLERHIRKAAKAKEKLKGE